MSKARLEAFSDGVIAIIITIMVLELHAPAQASWAALLPLLPVFVSYLVSFVRKRNGVTSFFFLKIHWPNPALWDNVQRS
jgi:uncharacterized membrane protein